MTALGLTDLSTVDLANPYTPGMDPLTHHKAKGTGLTMLRGPKSI